MSEATLKTLRQALSADAIADAAARTSAALAPASGAFARSAAAVQSLAVECARSDERRRVAVELLGRWIDEEEKRLAGDAT